MQTNKILLQHFFLHFIIAGTLSAGLLGTGAYMLLEKTNTQQKITPRDIFLSSFVIMGAFALLLPILSSYRKSQKIASKIMQQYLQEELLKHPELKQFEAIYTNPEALKNIAATVSNCLNSYEQNTILGIMTKIQQEGNCSQEAEEKAIKHAKQTIIKILENHAAAHPEFFNDLLVAVSKANDTYVLNANQNSR